MCLNINKLYKILTLIYVRSMRKISIDSYAEKAAIHDPHIKQTHVEITRVL